MVTKEPSVTVLVTVKNSVSTIKECIDSILRLNYKNKKIYVTDAYSTDGTWQILKKYGKKIKLEKVKGNIATAHNHMIRKCNTDFVALTDVDCVVDKNWLKYLIKAFKSDDILAVGGIVKTPSRAVNKLQELIGRELLDRFQHFPKYVKRLPTISLCIRTEYAKRIPFDEDFDVAQETDWGYKTSKIGKIAFVPKAIAYHSHRTTWKSYFKQQFSYAKFVFMLYFRKKHLTKVLGDEISKSSMALQILLIYFGFLGLLLGFLNTIFFIVSVILFTVLLITYFIRAMKLSKNFSDFSLFLAIFVVRNIAWCLGIIRGIFI